nr:DDT domain-containing protein PTM [Ipomoea batatas]
MEEYLGKTFEKEFEGLGIVKGTVRSYESESGLFEVVYEDGDSEELDAIEVVALLGGGSHSADYGFSREPCPVVGRKPKKRRRIGEEAGNSGCNLAAAAADGMGESSGVSSDGHEKGGVTLNLNLNDHHPMLNFDLNGDVDLNDDGGGGVGRVDLDLNLNEGLDLNTGVDVSVEYNTLGRVEENLSRSNVIDLNADPNEDANCAFAKDDSLECVSLVIKEKSHSFDLNLEAGEEEPTNLDVKCDMKDKGITVPQADSSSQKHERPPIVLALCCQNVGRPSMNLRRGLTGNKFVDGSLKEVELNLVDTGPAGVGCGNGISSISGKRRGRKRKSLSDAPDDMTEPMLRRSTRKARRAGLSSHDNDTETVVPDAANDPLSSPAQSVVSDEKLTVSSHEDSEERNFLPPKPELPPSSDKLDLEGISVLDIFSVYALLRSFSSLLFLSPFELEDFVASIKCNTPTVLFDSVHVSLLQMLRKHLESLGSESSESSSNCLRSLNWDLLDSVTWPIFLVEYLLTHNSGIKVAFDICHLKLFESDYYKQPTSVKIEILHCLCDDVIEVEAIRSELSRRTVITKPNIDFDQNMKLDSIKKRRVTTDLATGSCLTEDVDDETDDWNSDECCLCKMDGNLICCDGCPAAFHSKCVGIASSLLPDGDWYCPECIINRKVPWIKVGKSIRGAELLGIDPYGQLFYSCCSYLLVSDSWGDGSSFKYYDRNDLPAVIRALKSSEVVYRTLLVAISKLWDASSLIDGATSDLYSQNKVVCEDFPMMPLQQNNDIVNGEKPMEMVMISTCSGDQGCEKSESVDLSAKMEKQLGSSEESTDLSQAQLSNQNSSRSGMQYDSESKQQYIDAYVNFYSFAHSASSIVEELTHKPSDKSTEDALRSEEEIISAQLKAISKRSADFCWSNIQNLNVDARKEKCGWCFSCKVPECKRNCLFLMNDTGPAPERFSSEALCASKRNTRKGHLVDIMYHIICIEDRLHGLLLGPWLSPMYSQMWRESVLAASDVASLRIPLLNLELNLRQLALSAEWFKNVDSLATIGSACHIVTNRGRVSSRHGMGKKVLHSDLKSNPSSNAGSGLGLFWWRGGRLSRQLFSWKVLPRSLASKAARQGGCKKIPGILYPDGAELAKRSKFVAWRAAVETSGSVEQLALQVRDLDAHIRWNDIGNVNILTMIDKESKKPDRSFKKVIIRRRSSRGQVVKYLLDFGKRRFLPEIVLKYGSMLEESLDKRKRYWLEETYVPLHLLKAFEEKRIACKSNKLSPIKPSESKNIIKKPFKKKGLSYLFSKAEKSENDKCGHCNRDVLIREAVSCQYCNGFFHKRHVRKSTGTIPAQCVYTCYKCLDGKHVKSKTKVKLGTKKNKNTSKILMALHSRTKRRCTKDKQLAHSQNNTNKDPVVMPLRRSARRAKILSVQEKNIKKKIGMTSGKFMKSRRGRPKILSVQEKNIKKKIGMTSGKFMKSRKRTSKKPTEAIQKKKRTQFFHIYWLNGLLLSQKPNDERVALFRSKKLFVLSGPLGAAVDSPKCSLCGELKSTLALNYIACEVCGDWFHGDAFGLTSERLDILIGFKCHKCRGSNHPVCPCMPIIRGSEAKLVGLKSDAMIESANLRHLEEKFQSHVESNRSCLSGDDDKKQLSNVTNVDNEEDGSLHVIGIAQTTLVMDGSARTDMQLQDEPILLNENFDNSSQKDQKPPEEWAFPNDKSSIEGDAMEIDDAPIGLWSKTWRQQRKPC